MALNKGRDIGPLEFFLRAKLRLLGGKSVAEVHDKNFNKWFHIFDASKQKEYVWANGAKTSFTYAKMRYRKPGQLIAGPPFYIIFEGQPFDFDPKQILEPNKAAEMNASNNREFFTLGREFERYGDPLISEKMDNLKKIIAMIAIGLLVLFIIYMIAVMFGLAPSPAEFFSGSMNQVQAGTGGSTISGGGAAL